MNRQHRQVGTPRHAGGKTHASQSQRHTGPRAGPRRSSPRSGGEPAPRLGDPGSGIATMVVVSKRPWLWPHVARNILRQRCHPAAVVLATVMRDEQAIEALRQAIAPIPLEVVHPPMHAVLGELRNIAMQVACDLASDSGEIARVLMCTMDDDDVYAADYVAGVLDGWRRFPQAWVVGRASWARVFVSTTPPEEPPPDLARAVQGRVKAVAGATISIPAVVWRDQASLRYPAASSGEDMAIQGIAAGHVYSAPIGGFLVVRYRHGAHGHSWQLGVAGRGIRKPPPPPDPNAPQAPRHGERRRSGNRSARARTRA